RPAATPSVTARIQGRGLRPPPGISDRISQPRAALPLFISLMSPTRLGRVLDQGSRSLRCVGWGWLEQQLFQRGGQFVHFHGFGKVAVEACTCDAGSVTNHRRSAQRDDGDVARFWPLPELIA